MPELLLEILSEEIPARMQAKAADDLKRLVCDGLKKAGLEFSNAEAYVTPRRLALVVDGIPEKQPDISEERRGPSVDAPDKAIQGFLGSVGMTMDEVETRQTEKGMFLFAKIEKQGRLATDVLMEVLPARSPRCPGRSPCAGPDLINAGCGPFIRSSACSPAVKYRFHGAPLSPATLHQGTVS